MAALWRDAATKFMESVFNRAIVAAFIDVNERSDIANRKPLGGIKRGKRESKRSATSLNLSVFRHGANSRYGHQWARDPSDKPSNPSIGKSDEPGFGFFA